MKNLLIGFVVILGYKLLINVVHLFMVEFYKETYEKYIQNQNFDFTSYTESVKKLFRYANLPDITIPACEPIGWGYVTQGSVSVFDNMGSLREDIAAKMIDCFAKASGVFRTRIFECFSPFYWIECIIFLPQKTIKYLGLKDDAIFVKILQMIYWIVTPLLVAFRTDVYNYIFKLLGYIK